MRASRLLRFHLPVALAAALGATFAFGMALALTGSFGRSPGPAVNPLPVKAARPRQLDIVALGDSLTEGTGDARQGGYTQRLAEALRNRGIEVTLRNFAVAGAETGDLLKRLEESGVRARLATADVVLLSIGGNDLSHALRGATAGAMEPEAALASARTNLREILRRVRAENARAEVRVMGLYNPFEVTPSSQGEVRAQLLTWNHAIEEAVAPLGGVLVVPLADLFADRPDRLATDQFHPGPRGHALIADRVLTTLRADSR